jgi:hypothetical protein
MKNLDSIHAPKKAVGIWIRVSTEDQAQGDSPHHHEARARHYAAAKDWEVKEVYDLAGVSGKSVMEHPETKRMLADVRRGHISALIFSKLARLGPETPVSSWTFSDIFRDQRRRPHFPAGKPRYRHPVGPALSINMVASHGPVGARGDHRPREGVGGHPGQAPQAPRRANRPYGYVRKGDDLVPEPRRSPGAKTHV